MLNRIGSELSKSIKEQKWVYLEYNNKLGETTYFWAAITDIDVKRKRLIVDMFNPVKYQEGHTDMLSTSLYFENIKKATVLEETTFETPKKLLEKINDQLAYLSWLNFDAYDHRILGYLKRASDLDQTPYEQAAHTLEGIDETVLLKEGTYTLNNTQIDQIVERILSGKNRKEKHAGAYKMRTLALNDLAIATPRGLFIVAYYPVSFNPKEKSLIIKEEPVINKTFLTEGFTHNLANYLGIDPETFRINYKVDKTASRDELFQSLKPNERMDERPYLLDIVRDITINLDNEYQAINALHESGDLNAPLKAFFGNMTKAMKRKKDPSLVVLDEKVNIDQLRVIHNAMKQYVTYVQGPPGTGKTQTILNVLISAFFNDETVLVAATNNHPINGIMKKMHGLTYKGHRLPFPILRLGNRNYLLMALATIKEAYEKFKDTPIFDDVLDKDRKKKVSDTKTLNELLEKYEKRLELKDHLEVVESVIKTGTGFRNSVILNEEKNKLIKELKKNPSISNREALAHTSDIDERFNLWLNYMSIRRLKRLNEPRYEKLFKIIDMDDQNERLKAFTQYLKDKNDFRNLQRVFPFIATTLHSVPRLGPRQPVFDLTIIDEAGQANNAISLPAILRGERLLLVGDPNQLAPVVTIDPGINESLRKNYKILKLYDYKDNSILKTMQAADKISKFVLLRYHYRCQRPIIAFANRKYYGDQLIVETKSNSPDALTFYDVNNESPMNERHEARAEAATIKSLVPKERGKSIGIITPFRKQKELLETLIKPEKDQDIEIGTIHAFQGDEKDIVIISPAIGAQTSEKTFDWVKNNRELINVGTTRAKEKLLVVGDMKAIKKHSGSEKNDLLDLCTYIRKKKTKVIRKNIDLDYRQNIAGIKALNTRFEKELLETIAHLFSVHQAFKIKEKIMVKSVLENYKIDDAALLDYYFKAEFDFVVYDKRTDNPILAIELDGLEHENDEAVKNRDKKKNALCKLYSFKLLRIPNDYARRYQYIRNIIIDMLKA